MQRLTYQNTKGETLTLYQKPYVLRSISGLGLGNIAVSSSAGVYQDGETVRMIKRGKREVRAVLTLMAKSRQEMYQKRMEMLRILSPENAMDGTRLGRLFYENDHGIHWTWAVPMQGLEAACRLQNIQPNLSLSFSCPSPFWYEEKESIVSFDKLRKGFRLPFSMPLWLASSRMRKVIVNNGQITAPLEVMIFGSGEKPKIVNRTTGASITFVEALPMGQSLAIHTDPSDLYVHLIDEDGNASNAFGFLDPASSIVQFSLAPGENVIDYVPDGDQSNTRIWIGWYGAFEGV